MAAHSTLLVNPFSVYHYRICFDCQQSFGLYFKRVNIQHDQIGVIIFGEFAEAIFRVGGVGSAVGVGRKGFG
jgi:hypothetical protein